MDGVKVGRSVVLLLTCLVSLVGCRGSVAGHGEDLVAQDDLLVDDAAEVPVITLTWFDSATGLTWQKDPGDVELAWAPAIDYCRNYQGGKGWRLPDIDELRSLIRGCPDTISGGPCRESVQCSSAGLDCYDGEKCMGCMDWKGPGKNGCYWPSELDGPCEWYWSSTTQSDLETYACFAHFRMAHLSHDAKTSDMTHHVICVR